ncbi:MAG TPA: pitrilysin family protein [Thermodesulfobacteriota bacterium]|nr:pitrilysin family protein [Thermodesulfobacteriota bacterium]
MKAKILRKMILAFLLFCLCLQSKVVSAMPPVQRTVLPNQLILLFSQESSLPFVTIQLLIDSGSRRDPSGEEGLSYLTARGLLLGTSKRTVTAIHEELDFMGASLSSSSNRDYATLSLQVLKKDLEKGWDLFMDVLTQPTFPEDEIKREVEKTLAAIQSAEDQPDQVAEKEFQKTLFPHSPYGHPVDGTKESLPRMTREAMVRFYGTYYHPNNAILTVVGDISADEVKTKLLPGLAKWPKAEIPEISFKPSFAKEEKTVKIDRGITQANIIIGQIGVSRDNPDYYALTVMNYILGGGGFTSRLVEEIRNKRGLAYSVASFFDPGKYPGSFQIVLQTKNSSAREAIALSLQEMERIRKELVSEKELEGAKKYLIGSFPMRLNTQGKLVSFLTQVEYYGLGLDYPEKYPSLIQSVTREEVLRVAKKYLHPKEYILIIVANLKESGME